MKLLLTMAF